MKNLCLLIIVGGFLILSSCVTQEVSKSKGENVDEYSYELPFKKTYKSLRVFDLDEMTQIMNQKVDSYHEDKDTQALKEATVVALSRPNEDYLLEKVLPISKNLLEDLGEWETTVQTIVSESIVRLKSNTVNVSEKVTATIVLENIISEFRPDFIQQYETGGFETNVIESIGAQEIKLSDKVFQEKKLNQMKSVSSPFVLAQKLLDQKRAYFDKKSKGK